MVVEYFITVVKYQRPQVRCDRPPCSELG